MNNKIDKAKDLLEFELFEDQLSKGDLSRLQIFIQNQRKKAKRIQKATATAVDQQADSY